MNQGAEKPLRHPACGAGAGSILMARRLRALPPEHPQALRGLLPLLPLLPFPAPFFAAWPCLPACCPASAISAAPGPRRPFAPGAWPASSAPSRVKSGYHESRIISRASR